MAAAALRYEFSCGGQYKRKSSGQSLNIYWKLAGSKLRDIFVNISVMTDLIAALVYVQGFFFFHIAAFTVAPPTF